MSRSGMLEIIIYTLHPTPFYTTYLEAFALPSMGNLDKVNLAIPVYRSPHKQLTFSVY
jgi:hypothetical protein